MREQDILKIDQNNLDLEWIKQPDLVYEIAMDVANNRLRMDTLKDELSLLEATLSKEARSNPEDFEIEKVTEKAIEMAILSHEDYQAKQIECRDARYDYEINVALLNALEHKKRALESLVSLHGQSYFSTPRSETPPAQPMQKFLDEKKKKGVKKTWKR